MVCANSMSPSPEGVSVLAFGCYPRITPYRLTFILATGGLGIAKAVLVSGGRASSSTTIEWVTGVVVALSFQLLGSLEYAVRRPRCVDWIYTYDCLNILGRFVQTSSLGEQENTSTHSQEFHETLSADTLSPPMVTAYRLVVSAIVSCFGLAKMICAYLGFPGAMNTLEWIVAVPLTLSLYYLGLFEDMKDNAPRWFFDIDYSGLATFALQTGLFLIFALSGVLLCAYWIDYWAWILLLAWKSFHDTGAETSPQSHPIFAHAVKNAVFFLSLSMVQIGTLLLLMILWPLVQRTGWQRAIWVKFIIMLFLFCSLFFSGLALCIYSARMLFSLPKANDAPEAVFLQFLGEISYSTVPVHAIVRLLMGLWPGLAIVLFEAPIGFRRFYHDYLPKN